MRSSEIARKAPPPPSLSHPASEVSPPISPVRESVTRSALRDKARPRSAPVAIVEPDDSGTRSRPSEAHKVKGRGEFTRGRRRLGGRRLEAAREEVRPVEALWRWRLESSASSQWVPIFLLLRKKNLALLGSTLSLRLASGRRASSRGAEGERGAKRLHLCVHAFPSLRAKPPRIIDTP